MTAANPFMVTNGTTTPHIQLACVAVNTSPTCAAPEAIGQLAWGASTTRIGTLPAGGYDEKWYSVSFSGSGDLFHPHVFIVSGVGARDYLIDVYSNCQGTRFGNSNHTTLDSFATQNWEQINTLPGQITGPVQPGTTIFIRVRPITANASCTAYSVHFMNG